MSWSGASVVQNYSTPFLAVSIEHCDHTSRSPSDLSTARHIARTKRQALPLSKDITIKQNSLPRRRPPLSSRGPRPLQQSQLHPRLNTALPV